MEDLLREISHDPYLFQINDFVDSGWIGHAPFLKFLIRELKPSLFVELGIHNGFSYFVGCQAISECNLEAKAFAVDHWKGDQQAGFFDNSVYESVKMLNSKYSNFSSILNVSFEDALNDFFDSSIDVLHIDGYHSYESVKNDFESWLPKLKKDGVILLHDISVRRDTFGVHKLWAEIKMQHNTIEFVGSHGLGVVFLGKIPVGRLRDLVEYSQAGNSSQVQGIFGSIADDVIQNFRYLKVQTVIAERDRVIAERDRVIAERDRVIAERDRVIAERDAILNSRIWRCFSAYRKAKNLLWGS